MFPCGWCGNPIDSYAAHFAEPHGRPCQTAARRPAPQLVLLDAGHATDSSVRAQAERNRIRNASKRRLARTNRKDLLELAPLTGAELRRSADTLARRHRQR